MGKRLIVIVSFIFSYSGSRSSHFIGRNLNVAHNTCYHEHDQKNHKGYGTMDASWTTIAKRLPEKRFPHSAQGRTRKGGTEGEPNRLFVKASARYGWGSLWHISCERNMADRAHLKCTPMRRSARARIRKFRPWPDAKEMATNAPRHFTERRMEAFVQQGRGRRRNLGNEDGSAGAGQGLHSKGMRAS